MALVACLGVGALAISGCGSAGSGSGTIHFAKTKFVLHMGLAAGAFHRYIYKPYKQGKFTGGLLHHKLATVKAGLAAGFAYHEVRLALDDARSSKVLSTLLSPLLALQTKLSTLRSQLTSGNVNPDAITSANSDAGAISSQSASKGQPIQDQASPSLSG